MKTVSLRDIARAAGVGLATVDRVVNNRGGVRLDTAARVLEVARRLGINRLLPPLYTRPIRIDAILLSRNPAFYRRLGDAFADVALAYGDRVVVQRSYVDGTDGGAIARKVRADRGDCDGIVVTGSDHPDIRAAIDEVSRQGKAVVTLISDVADSARLAYVGIDNAAAGRTAAYFLGRSVGGRGRVLFVTGDTRNSSQTRREDGFREALARRFPDMRVAGSLVGREDDRRTFQLVADALAADPEVTGIYNTAGAVPGTIDAIRAQRRRVACVAHELTPDNRRLLRDGVLDLVIDQNPELQAWRAVESIAIRFALVSKEIDTRPIPFTLHGPENVD